MRRIALLALSFALLAPAFFLRAQQSAQNPARNPDDEAAKNAKQARAVLDKMVEALGGQAWLDIKNREQHGHVAAFFHDNPDPGTHRGFRIP